MFELQKDPKRENGVRRATIETPFLPNPLLCDYVVTGKAASAKNAVLLLHGGDANPQFLDFILPWIEQSEDADTQSDVAFFAPLTGRSLFADKHDGSEFWEKAIVQSLVEAIDSSDLIAAAEKRKLGVVGISMGGLGALRIGLKHPDRFTALAALCPGIEASLRFEDIKLRDRFGRSDEFYASIFGSPVDEAFWQANNPANIAIENRDAILSHELKIAIECGNTDCYLLHHGTEFLHRILFDQRIPHNYHLIDGADHLDRTMADRFVAALQFVTAAFDPPPPDTSERNRAVQRVAAEAKIAAGYYGEDD